MRDEVRYRTSLVALLVLVLVGCQKPSAVEAPETSAKPIRVVTDDLGRTVTVPVKIMRVVSTAPSVTENIFAAGAGDRLVGVTTFCNYPVEAKAIPKIGDTITPNMESIIALKPDVVFVSTASQIEAFTQTLADNGIAVYVTNPTSFDDVIDDLGKLGDLFGTTDRVGQMLPELKRRVEAVQDSVRGEEQLGVFVQISREPLFTVGKGSFLNVLIEKAGGRSVTVDIETAYPKLSKESAIALEPDVIIISESPDNEGPNEVFRNSPALKSGRVYKINADLLSRPGPRLVDALEQIARCLHPEKFN
ncbi:MAG: cobalamin-binding protein [Chloracidobacterium sp.]|nr:cobalamin-binding protein [Chloracidobacterium sp.]